VHDDLDATLQSFGECPKRQRPIEGSRCERETTVSATDTASTVTWWRRITYGFSSMPRRYATASSAVVTPASRSGGVTRNRRRSAQTRKGATGAFKERHEGVGDAA